jgi:ribokinase
LNQAIVAARAGANVEFVTALGDDENAARIGVRLEAEGLTSKLQILCHGQTDRSIILVGQDGENMIVSTDRQAKSLRLDDMRDALDRLTQGDLLLMQGNLSQVVTEGAFTAAREAGALCMLNPAPITWSYDALLPLVDVLVVNEVEALMLTGMVDPDRAASQLRARGCDAVIVTLGAAGALLRSAGSCADLPAPPVEACDTTGAGDVFVGVLGAALADGVALESACRWAIRAASLSVTRPGTSESFPSRAELALLHAEAESTIPL